MATFSSLPSSAPPPASFVAKKAKILQQLGVGHQDYTDLSPKGSVDDGIREIIGGLNAVDGLVTTSSCAGRISVFLEGRRNDPSSTSSYSFSSSARRQTEGEEAGGSTDTPGETDGVALDERYLQQPQTQAGVGGKGGGGAWLFVSHDPVDTTILESDDSILELFGLRAAGNGDSNVGKTEPSTPKRLVHFKFEPMILHVLTASPSHAQMLLKCALQSGFRESGALNITPSQPLRPSNPDDLVTPMVAVRTNGLALESLVGIQLDSETDPTSLVSSGYLRMLLDIGNERFVENAKRIGRFREAMGKAVTGGPGRGKMSGKARKKAEGNGTEWEDAVARRERKRQEGLRRKAEMETAGEGRGGRPSLSERGLDDDDYDGIW